MMFFMADGFLLDRMIEPDLSEDLYATMIGVFLRGLEAMSAEAPLSVGACPVAASPAGAVARATTRSSRRR